MIIVIGFTDPYSSSVSNKMELYNEAFVLVSTYHFYEFTDFMVNVSVRESIGKSLVVLTCLNVLVNLGVAFITSLIEGIRKLKLFYLGWKQTSEIKR
jgi:hypothetical protein